MAKLLNWAMCGLLGMGLLSASALLVNAAPKNVDAPKAAKEAAPKPAPKPQLSGKWAQMAAVAKLSTEQQEALAAKVKAMDAELKKFDESKAAQLKELKEKGAAMAEERKALSDKLTKDAMSSFTPEQVNAFELEEAVTRAVGPYKAVFDEQQMAKAKDLVAAAGKATADIKADDKEAAARKAEITKKLNADIAALVTPEQKARMAAMDAEREARKGAKAGKLTPDGEKAVAAAASEAAVKLADLNKQREKIIDDLRAKINAEAEKAAGEAKKAAEAKSAARKK